MAAARAGAAELIAFRNKFAVREKAPADLVTDADLASEKAIRQLVESSYPKHTVLGEEGGLGADREMAEYCWVVDPLDGTTNYVHGIPFYCVSIAVQKNGQTIVGAVFDPNREEMFAAADGQTAVANDIAIETTALQLHQAVLAVSLPPRPSKSRWEIARLERIANQCQAFRRTGSAALNLCYVAAGRIDGIWAPSLNLWDWAAGAVIVREAGGVVTDLSGDPPTNETRGLVVAGNRQLHRELLAEVGNPKMSRGGPNA